MIRADSAGIGNLARDLARVAADVPKTFRQAALSVARASGTEAKREITAIYNVKQQRAGEAIKSYADGYEVITTGKAKGITLQSFGGKQAAKGYLAAVRKGRRRLIKGGFTPPKFAGVPFKREGKERTPIKVLYGPSVASMLRNNTVRERFTLRQSIRARDELTRRIFRELSKR